MSVQDPFLFIKAPRALGKELPVPVRVQHHGEIYQAFEHEQAKEQADRCLDCGNPYCEWKCPVHNRIPEWLKLIGEGRLIEAVELSHSTNPLPEICGRVCPQDRLCEGACTLEAGFGAVSIGAIEKYITDTALASGWRPNLQQVKATGKKVAIIGAGPAGLACADGLARAGIQAVVFDRHPEIGGLLSFGIPGFKLDKAVVQQRREILEGMGVEFRLGTEVSDLEAMRADFDAIFLGLGTYQAKTDSQLDLSFANVHQALDYLVPQGYELLGHTPQQALLNLAGKHVVVLGGGDTAMDCNRTAIRQGAASVTCIYRGSEARMPGSKREVKNAKDEGVHFRFHEQPTRLLGNEGKLSGVRVRNTEAGKGELETDIHADVVLVAFGFQASPPAWLQPAAVEIDGRGLVKVSKKFRTANAKIYAGGDMVRGSDLVVTAVYEGREAAKAIAQDLLG